MAYVCRPHTSSQELYVGLSPYTGPAVFSLLAGTELTDGVWYPKACGNHDATCLLRLRLAHVTAPCAAILRRNPHDGAARLCSVLCLQQGGFQKVRDGLETMAKRNGANIRLNTPVQRILMEACEKESSSDKTIGRAVGVELASGERLYADVVVANPDIPYAYDKLLPDGGEEIAKEAERIAKWDYRRGNNGLC